jgi:hypothetical protein
MKVPTRIWTWGVGDGNWGGAGKYRVLSDFWDDIASGWENGYVSPGHLFGDPVDRFLNSRSI